METKQRRVNLNKLITYIEKNYRTNLNERDYEFIKTIADSYLSKEIKLAIDYCKNKKTDSLVYLQDALAKKYYINKKQETVPNWISNSELCVSDPMTKQEEKELENILKKYK